MIDLTFNITDNDCEVITDEDNMIASSIRRLNTRLNTTLYDQYGGNFYDLQGLKQTEINLQFLNQSITETLLQDERVTSCNVNCEYTNNTITADIQLTYADYTLEFNYELGDTTEDDDVGDDE